jgi:hypothetical protein
VGEENPEYNGSNVFSIGLTQDQPEPSNKPILYPTGISNQEDPKKEEPKTAIANSIQELDNLIKKMVDSNESYPKDSTLYEPSETKVIKEDSKEKEES